MENQAYTVLAKQSKQCRLFRDSKSNESPEEELKKLFRKSISHLRSAMRCSRGACRLKGRSQQYLPWLLHYRTTRLGCAGAYCGSGRRKTVTFHCLSDYGKDSSGGLLFRQRGDVCDDLSCRDYVTVGSTPFDCRNKLHLCTNNMDYRQLTTDMCAQTCGRCGMRDQALHYE
uniref:ShKT domain-containing protein n=1 Tax=Ditylenchus dipsaci TaxID=166011 RepID=A0A915DMX6_9BILA